MPVQQRSEVLTYNVHGNGNLSRNQLTANKQTVISNGIPQQNGYKRGMSSGSSSSPLSTASSSGSTVISR